MIGFLYTAAGHATENERKKNQNSSFAPANALIAAEMD